jgi:fatty-acyl-CoA synthase
MTTPWSLIEMQAKVTPTALALVTPDSVMRFAELRAAVLGVASRLARLPLKPGDTIGIAMAGPDDQLLFALGAMRQGIVTAPVMSPQAFASLERPALVLTDGSRVKPDGVYTLEVDASWYAIGEMSAPDEARPAADAPCRVYLSSGSTGRPKATMQSFGGLSAQVENTGATLSAVGGSRRLLTLMQPSSPWGLRTALVALIRGGAIYYSHDVDSAVRFALVNACDYLVCSVQQLRGIVDLQRRNFIALPALRAVGTAGSIIPLGLVQETQALLARNVLLIYGSSEAGLTAFELANMQPWQDGATGYITPWTQVRIVDEDGNEVQPGDEGEVLVRSTGQVPGLGEAAPDGGLPWFRPGDRGSVSPDGRLTIIGRIGSVFNIGGVKIAADRIEEVLLSHPAVKDAGAIAVRGEDGVDVIEAAVVLSAAATPEDIIAHMRQRMPSAAPRRIVVVKAIPRGGDANKVQREDLKRMMTN